MNNKIIPFLKGELNKEEEKEFFSWVYANEENKNEYFKQKDIWDAYKMNATKDEINIQKEWQIQLEKISNLKKEKLISQHLSFWIKMAAVIIVVFGLGWMASYVSSSLNTPKPQICKLEVPKGQQSKLTLVDGTEIWLNSDSQMSFYTDNVKNERVVDLTGEAYFHVSKNKDKPFMVNVRGQQIKVLGTIFNVRAYKNEMKVFTTLEEGSIEIKAAGRTVTIKPQQQFIYNKFSNRLSLKKVDTNYYTVWKEGRYIFDNEKFDTLIAMVERWYDVQIDYPKEFFQNMHYSGVIKKTNPVEHVLKLINHTTPIEYKIEYDRIIIKPIK